MQQFLQQQQQQQQLQQQQQQHLQQLQQLQQLHQLQQQRQLPSAKGQGGQPSAAQADAAQSGASWNMPPMAGTLSQASRGTSGSGVFDASQAMAFANMLASSVRQQAEQATSTHSAEPATTTT